MNKAERDKAYAENRALVRAASDGRLVIWYKDPDRQDLVAEFSDINSWRIDPNGCVHINWADRTQLIIPLDTIINIQVRLNTPEAAAEIDQLQEEWTQYEKMKNQKEET